MHICSCIRGNRHLRQDQIGQVAELFSLLGDPNRLRIVLACLDGPRSVGEIAEAVGASPSLTSHHLRLLRTARLLRRSGRDGACATSSTTTTSAT